MDSTLILENYLLVLKSTVEVFVHGTLESSNSIVRTTLKKCLDTIMDSQNNTFQLMSKSGWYNVNNVENSKVLETINELSNAN